MMACEGEAGTVEAAVMAVLDGSVDVVVEGDSLTVTNGDRGLVYTAT
jgi:heat shock protein HslJ